MYQVRKKSVGEHKGNQHTRKMECAQNENIPKQQNRISYQIAEELKYEYIIKPGPSWPGVFLHSSAFSSAKCAKMSFQKAKYF